jgi:hypothetical protein
MDYKNLSDKELYATCKKYGLLTLDARRKFASTLPEVQRRKLYKKRNFNSIYEFAAKLAGMSKSAVDDTLWTMRKVEDKPELKRVAIEKGVNRVKPVANIATKETDAFWAKKAQSMSQNVLRTYIQETNARKTEPNFWVNPKTQPENSTEVRITIKLKRGLVDRLKKQGDLNEMMEKFLDFVEKEKDIKEAEKLSVSEVSEINKPKPVKTKSRHIPIKIKRHVMNKTNGKCAFPGCCKKAKILHHTQRFALEKIHDPDKITPLCTEHECLAHLGLIENENRKTIEWKLRKEPDKTDVKQFIDQMVWLRR